MFNILKTVFYEIKSYFVSTPNPYIRTGECKKCGKCCRELYSVDTYTETEFKIMQFLYPPYRRFYIKEKKENGLFVFACKFVKDNGECSVYKKRPIFCKTYPIHRYNYPLTLHDGCGFKFVKKEFKEFLTQKKSSE